MKKNFYKILLLLFYCYVFLPQVNAQLIIKGKIIASQTSLTDVNIQVAKNNTVIKNITPDVNGKFQLEFQLNGEYALIVRKANYITKKYLINSYCDDPSAKYYPMDEVEILLLKKHPELDTSVFDDYVGTIKYQTKNKSFIIENDLDKRLTQQYQVQLKQQAELDKDYQKFIDLADAAFAAEKYQDAQNYYNKALSIKPNESYPRYRIEDGIALQEIKEKENLKNKLKERDNAYQYAIMRADKAFKEKRYQDARNNYVEALEYKYWEPYPKAQIEKIDKILAAPNLDEAYNKAIQEADKLFLVFKYPEALQAYKNASNLKPWEPYPREQIKRITELLGNKNIEAEYAKKISQADELFNKKQYPQARIMYSEALKIKPAEQYPKSQIAKIDELLKQQGIDKQYNDLIAIADGQFNAKQYNDAKTTYTNALKIKSNEQYPKDQIAKIDEILKQQGIDKQYNDLIVKADGQFNAKQYNDAKTTYTDALKIKPAEQYPKDQIAKIDELLKQQGIDKQYNDLIAKADGQFNAKQYNDAKTTYTDALKIKPNEQYPKDQIDKINLMIQLMLTDAEYRNVISKADLFFNNKQYSEAKATYNQALKIKPNETYPVKQIELINQRIADLLKQSKGTGSTYIVIDENMPKDVIFQKYVTAADEELARQNYTYARYYYTKALEIRDDPYPKKKLKDLDDEINAILATSRQVNFDEAMRQANIAMQNKNYTMADFYLKNAAELKPNDSTVLKKQEELRKILEASINRKK